MIQRGSTGDCVKKLQQKLGEVDRSFCFKSYCLGVAADGVFGPNTQAAVVTFQRSRALAADGVVGPQTWAALGGASGPQPNNVMIYYLPLAV